MYVRKINIWGSIFGCYSQGPKSRKTSLPQNCGKTFEDMGPRIPWFMSRKPSRTFYNEPINLDALLARATSAQWCVCVISQPQICNLPRMSSLPNSKIGYIPYSPCQIPAAPAYSILRLLSSSTIERVLASSLPMEQTAGIVFVSLGRVQVG